MGWYVAGIEAVLLAITLAVLWVSEKQFWHIRDKYKAAQEDLASLARYRRGETIGHSTLARNERRKQLVQERYRILGDYDFAFDCGCWYSEVGAVIDLDKADFAYGHMVCTKHRVGWPDDFLTRPWPKGNHIRSVPWGMQAL